MAMTPACELAYHGSWRAVLARPSKRRRTLNQLNRGEDRHKLARAVFHGRRGELRQRYREGQEDQLSALGVVVNIIVLWNTSTWMPRLNSFDTKASGLTRRTKPGSPL
jgi:TnpA family transposase